ncbi:hypothetical protein ALI22I_09720 [Saccharothrix sp. ALI-22-I]|nr:hypothetical protein ALI22I_09720 [Saccharothrix sp. ALI-22-I]
MMRTPPGSPLELPPGATATRWVERLTAVDAEVLAEYDHPHFGRRPAITTRRHCATGTSPISGCRTTSPTYFPAQRSPPDGCCTWARGMYESSPAATRRGGAGTAAPGGQPTLAWYECTSNCPLPERPR